ncbi:conjugal transfer protein TraI (plasmid) [Novosphingobium sp. EMRT-2]|nr:conjugal transfer protein TraI [Novosphingobium sp. EMRT-2]
MIAKHVPMKATAKSDFGGLVRYITSAQGRDERVGLVTITNCQGQTPEDAAQDAMFVQAANQRAASDKTYHLIISFRPGETPSAEVLRDVEEKICAALGYAEHQRISAVHHDTDNTHIHLAINKVHPTRHTIHTPLRDYKTLAVMCAQLEAAHGLERDNHESRKRGGANRAGDMEQIAGTESLIGWAQRNCAEPLKAAASWTELHQIAADFGLSVQARGNGLIFAAMDGTAIKASSIARELSKGALEKRLGAFQDAQGRAGASKARQTYEKRPLPSRIDTSALFAAYRAQQGTRADRRKNELAEAAAKRHAAIEQVKRIGRTKRAAIKLLGGGPAVKRLNYALAARSTKAAIDKIVAAHGCERERITARNTRRGWNDWLQEQAKAGDQTALEALRAREGRRSAPKDALHVAAMPSAAHPAAIRQDHITKRGTIIYRTANAAVRDDGQRLHVSRGAQIEGVVAALRLAHERYGDRLAISGSDQFKALVVEAAARSAMPITFADPDLEARRQTIRQEERDRDRQIAGRGDRGGAGVAGRNAVNGAGRDASTTAPGRNGTFRPGAVRAAGTDAGIGRAAGGASASADGAGPAQPARNGHSRAGGAEAASERAVKPNIGRIGRKPPPESRGHLRDLSQLGVVQHAERGGLLLPRHVHSDVDDQKAGPDRPMRRSDHRERLTEDQLRAADKYIAERNAKRHIGMDIPAHRLFTGDHGPLIYAGTRQVEGQKLILLKDGADMLVLPVDARSAARAGKLAVGAAIDVASNGTVKSKGRSR